MPRVENDNLPPTGAPRGAIPPDAPFYRYDPNLGSPRDSYTRADVAHPAARQPEVAGRFQAYVEGETLISTMHGSRRVVWHAEPGTQCIILGYWSDGTVHLKWPAIAGVYTVDGRFPAWVAAVDMDATLAGGRILSANDPVQGRQVLPVWLLSAAGALLVALLALVFSATHEALSNLAYNLFHLPH